MADAVGLTQHIVELGVGTGAITEALRRKHPDTPMTLFEQNVSMANQLKARFPDADLVVDFLHKQTARLEGLPEHTAMVSSLPFRAFEGELLSLTVRAVCEFIAQSRGRKLVQYTYQLRVPFEPDRSGLRWTRRRLVLANLPPAHVWELMLDR
jgi:phospholipid N-methyltransferase